MENPARLWKEQPNGITARITYELGDPGMISMQAG